MKIRVEDKGACRKIVYIEVPAESVTGEYDKVVSVFTKAAKIPGFRPGKAPRDVVEKHYEKRIIDEAKDRLLPGLYKKAIESKKIEAVNIINLSEVDFSRDRGMNFSVTVDVMPEFRLPKYKKIVLRKNKIEVSESDVDDTIKRILDNFSKFEDVQGRAVKRDDLVMVDYTSSTGGESVEKIAGGTPGLGDGKDFWMMVGEPELVPGFTAGLVGMLTGSTKEIQVHFPEDYRTTSLAGKDAVYNVTLKSIREKVLPRLDEDLLKRFDVKSETELRERVRKDLTEERQHLEKIRLKNEITSFLLEKSKFDLPASVVEHEAGVAARSMLERLASQGRSKAQIESEKNRIIESARKSAEERVRAAYILRRIADEENIVPDDADLDERLKSMALRYGMSVSQLRGELEKRDGLDSIRGDIRSDKTLDFLLDNAKIKG